MYDRRVIWPLALMLLFPACASPVRKSDGVAPAPVGIKASGKSIVLNLIGSEQPASAQDWADFRGTWHDECQDEFNDANATLVMQKGEPQPTGSEGVLVVVDVRDYRFVSTGARVMLGDMTGDAFIESRVGFRDLQTGATWSTKAYDTKSSAWDGVFAAVTPKQVRAICHEILGEISTH